MGNKFSWLIIFILFAAGFLTKVSRVEANCNCPGTQHCEVCNVTSWDPYESTCEECGGGDFNYGECGPGAPCDNGCCYGGQCGDCGGGGQSCPAGQSLQCGTTVQETCVDVAQGQQCADQFPSLFGSACGLAGFSGRCKLNCACCPSGTVSSWGGTNTITFNYRPGSQNSGGDGIAVEHTCNTANDAYLSGVNNSCWNVDGGADPDYQMCNRTNTCRIETCIVPPPTDPTASCPAPGTTANLDWSGDGDGFAVRLYRPADGSPWSCGPPLGHQCIDVPDNWWDPSTTATHTYSWKVQSKTTAGLFSEDVYGPNFTCAAAPTPTTAPTATPVPPTNTPVPPTPTPIPPPTLTCTAYTNPVSIVWNWTVNGVLTYLLQVWNSTNTIVYQWYTGPTVTTSAVPGVTQWGHVLSGDGTQSSPWSNTASCTIPALSTPTGSCGTFDPVTATTPVTWTWANGTGLQVTKNSPPSSNPAIENWLYNAAALSGKVISGVAPGTLMYARTTYVNEFSAFSSDGRIQPAPYYCPLPDNQTAVISGVLRQKSGTGCYQADGSNNFSLAPPISATTGDSCVSASCTASPGNSNAVSYNCIVTWDNAGCVAQGRQPNTTQTLTLTSGATGYSSGQFTNASCTPINPPPNDKKVTIVAGVNSTADIAFTFSGSNWIKLKDSSYNGVSITGVTVPAFVNSYDADDDATKYFIIGNAGAVLKATVNPSSAYSSPPKNWYDSSYPAGSSSMNPSAFLNYVKSRKEYQTVNAMSSINQDGIYVWSGAGALTLNNANLNQATASKFVLIVDGNVTIDQDKFNIANCTDASGLKKIAILSKTGTIAFSTSTQCAAGVFIAQTVNTGSITSQGLKIKGNLIALTTLTNGRAWSDTSRPGLFVVFDPAQYINLLPYLSTASYDWRQIQ